MNRNVYLQGELAERFGEKLVLNVPTIADLFKLLHANDPSMRQYLVDCHEKGVGFACEVADREITEEDGIQVLEEGDLFVTPVPAGSRSGGAKILAAIFIVAVMAATGGFGAEGWASKAFMGVEGITYGQVLGGLAVSLALQGIQQLMLPDPSTDGAGPKAYLFDGAATNFQEGDPVPLLYGELRVPGRPISFEVMNENTQVSGMYPDFMFEGVEDFQFQQTTPDGHQVNHPAYLPEIETGT